MLDVNPLEMWLMYEGATSPELDRMVESWLSKVEREVEQPKPSYPFVRFSDFPLKVPHALQKRAEALFPRVFRGRGSGKRVVEISLLSLVGAAADPTSIPFWKDTVASSRVADKIASQRRQIAAAALAYTAVQHPESDAFAALVALTEDEHIEARLGAVEALAYLAINEELVGPLASKSSEALRRVARDARAFAPRFLARHFLAIHGEPLPEYEHDNVIAFDVGFGDCHRTIELLADQTLVDLHFAILAAFGWDTDHLFQFSLNGDLRDERFALPAPDEESVYFDVLGEAQEEQEEPAQPPFPVGAMGLPVGHEIAYLYDFGDHNVFRIKVADVHAKAPRLRYPRVTAKVGKSPEQYPSSW